MARKKGGLPRKKGMNLSIHVANREWGLKCVGDSVAKTWLKRGFENVDVGFSL